MTSETLSVTGPAATILAELPVYILADTSGSMAHERKIAALNASMRELIATTARQHGVRILLAVIAFGNRAARTVHPLGPASAMCWLDLDAEGDTPLVEALSLARETIERDFEAHPEVLRPVVVLVSDGRPTDEERVGEALDRFDASPQAGACDRLVLAIGPDADMDFMAKFVRPFATAETPLRIVQAGSEADILAFFRYLPHRLQDAAAATPEDLVLETGELR